MVRENSLKLDVRLKPDTNFNEVGCDKMQLKRLKIRICCFVDACCVSRYNGSIIKSFKHKGLEQFFLKGTVKGVQPKHAKKLRLQLIALDTAICIEDLDLPGYRQHPLKGSRKGFWSITVNGNWRITFEFQDGNVYIVNYEDYH